MNYSEAEIIETLARAQTAALAKKWSEAECLLRPIAEHPGALHLLGLILLEQKHFGQGVEKLEKALLLGGAFSLHEVLARQYFQEGMFHDAARHYQVCLNRSLMLEDADMHRYALALYELGDYKTALGFLEQLLLIYPQQALLCMHIGNTLFELGQSAGALDALKTSHQLEPENIQVRYNLARVLLATGQLEATHEQLKVLLLRAPNYVPAYLLQARMAELNGDPEQALKLCTQAVQLDPQHGPAWHNLGLCYMNLYYGTEAEYAFEKALAFMPGDTLVIKHLARLKRNIIKAEEACQLLEKLSQIEPRTRFQEAYVLPPVYRSSEDLGFWQQHFQERLNSLELISPNLDDPLIDVPLVPFYLAYTGLHERPLMEQLRRIFAQACPELVASFVPSDLESKSELKTSKIRLGIVSSAYREHTVFHLFGHLFRTLDPQIFELIAFSQGTIENNVAAYLKQYTEKIVSLPDELELARGHILETDLDILLYLDVGMTPLTWYLSLSRLAPLQYLTWGHGITTGSTHFDGFLSSHELETHQGQAHYSEPLITMPTLLGQWQLPDVVLPEFEMVLPAGRLYLCPQSLYKFHPDFDPYLAGVLAQDSEAQLILVRGMYPEWDQALKTRWQGQMDLSRVHFLPRLNSEQYLALLSRGDVMLDPWPFGGGLSLMQALSLGVPVVTQTGSSLKNRLGTALCQQIQWTEGLVTNQEDYISAALKLAKQGRAEDISARYAKNISQEQAGRDLSELLSQAHHYQA